MYSLVTPSVLAADLAVHSCADHLLTLFTEFLVLAPDSTTALAAEAQTVDPMARFLAWDEVRQITTGQERIESALRRAVELVADATEERKPLTDRDAQRLARVPIGTFDHLIRFVQCEIVDAQAESRDRLPPQQQACAQHALIDVAAAGWVRGSLAQEHTDVLASPWHRARDTTGTGWTRPLPAVLGASADQVQAAQKALEHVKAPDLEFLLEVNTARTTSTWPQLMHAAAWAAYGSARLTAVAVAQLGGMASLLVAARNARWGPAQIRVAAAPVCAAMTALVLGDALDTAVRLGLLAPLEAIGAAGRPPTP